MLARAVLNNAPFWVLGFGANARSFGCHDWIIIGNFNRRHRSRCLGRCDLRTFVCRHAGRQTANLTSLSRHAGDPTCRPTKADADKGAALAIHILHFCKIAGGGLRELNPHLRQTPSVAYIPLARRHRLHLCHEYPLCLPRLFVVIIDVSM